MSENEVNTSRDIVKVIRDGTDSTSNVMKEVSSTGHSERVHLATLSASGDQAKLNADSAQFISGNGLNPKITQSHEEGDEKKDNQYEDHSNLDEERGGEPDEDAFDVEDHICESDEEIVVLSARDDPSSLVVVGQQLRLHTPPKEDVGLESVKETRRPSEEEEDIAIIANYFDPPNEDGVAEIEVSTPLPTDAKKTSSRRPTLSPVVEEDAREFAHNWAYVDGDDDDGDDGDDGDDIDCGAGDAAASAVETLIAGTCDEDYAVELSRALSSAAVDAALAELKREESEYESTDYQDGLTDTAEELDNSDDDIVVILPEAHELNYHNVPVGASVESSLQEAAHARNQLEAQADFLENSLNCLEITLDRMSLNEAVMPDGSVVFLKDQLRKSRTGHLLRAWEKAKGLRDEYTSDGAELNKPLAHMQRELYQEQIKNFRAANEDMRTAVTQATLQEQALRGKERQLQKTFGGLDQKIAEMSQNLVGLHSRQQNLQAALMEERKAKEAAQREQGRICRQSSSDTLPPNYEVSSDERIRSRRQSGWGQDQSASTSSTEDVPTTVGMSSPVPQGGPTRWWRGRREFLDLPPWRRGDVASRPPFARRQPFVPRPWRRGWNWNRGREPYDGPRPWDRRRPSYAPRPYTSRPPRPRPPPPPPPIPFTQPFKRETETLLLQYFNEMGRVENLLRERGFAKGPTAAAPAPTFAFRRRGIRPPPRFMSDRSRAPWNVATAPPFHRPSGLGSRSMPAMGVPYRDRSQRSTRWFETSRSQTSNSQLNGYRHPEGDVAASASMPQAAASA